MNALALAALLLAPAARAADCVAPGSLPALLDQAEAMDPQERAGLDLAAFLTPVVYDFACRGVTGGGDPCAELSGYALRIPGARSLEWNCRQRRAETEFSLALLRKDPRAPEVCASFLAAQMGVADPAKARALCAGVVAKGAAGDADLCRAVIASEGREATPMRLQGCASALKMYRGEMKDCEAMMALDYLAADQPLCRALRGLRSGDCRGEPLCRALSPGGAAFCAQYGERAKTAFAARRTVADRRSVAPGAEGAPKMSVADDVIPQVPSFPGAPKAPAAAPAKSGPFPAERRTSYPTFTTGELLLPQSYEEGSDYAAVDRQALSALTRVAHHLADVNIAYQEGYRPRPTLDTGSEVAFVNEQVRLDSPGVLRYAVDAKTGRYQLVRVGFLRGIPKGPSPAPPFSASGARWRIDPREHKLILDVGLPVYNINGMFAESFADAARLAAAGVRSFYGAPVPPTRAPRPLCRP